MNKRGTGGIVLGIVLIVLLVALLGLYYLKAPAKAPAEQTPTGYFALPAQKEYGGEITGIAMPGGRAFPGRALEMPSQDCYSCSCLDQGITSATSEAAARVCSENCGGTVSKTHSGIC